MTLQNNLKLLEELSSKVEEVSTSSKEDTIAWYDLFKTVEAQAKKELKAYEEERKNFFKKVLAKRFKALFKVEEKHQEAYTVKAMTKTFLKDLRKSKKWLILLSQN